MNKNTDEILLIKSDPEDVAALLHDISLNRTEISTFLDSVTPITAMLFCAYFVGQMAAQDSSILTDFHKAVDVSIQVAKVMHQGQEMDSKDGFLFMYPPAPSNESQLSFEDATGFSV